MGSYLGDKPFSKKVGIVNLHTAKRTHWVAFINQNYFDSDVRPPTEKLLKFNNIKLNGSCLFSESEIQGMTIKRNSYCAAFCLCILYLTNVSGMDLKTTVLKSHDQMIPKLSLNWQA